MKRAKATERKRKQQQNYHALGLKGPDLERLSRSGSGGRYQNVFLSDMEIAELQTELPDFWQRYNRIVSLFSKEITHEREE